MKKIETKIAKNGTKMYYVEGKRVNREDAIETVSMTRETPFTIEYTAYDTKIGEVVDKVITTENLQITIQPIAHKYDMGYHVLARSEQIACKFGYKNDEEAVHLAKKNANATVDAIVEAYVTGAAGVKLAGNIVAVIRNEAYPDEYAVSDEALEVAINAEIELAKEAEREEIISNPLITEDAFEEAYYGELMNAYNAEINPKKEAYYQALTEALLLKLTLEEFETAMLDTAVTAEAFEIAVNAETELANNAETIDKEETQMTNNLPTGIIEVANGADAFALVAPYFPNGLTFKCAGKGFNHETIFSFADKNDDELWLNVCSTADDNRIECVEVLNTHENGSKRHPLTVAIVANEKDYYKERAELADKIARDAQSCDDNDVEIDETSPANTLVADIEEDDVEELNPIVETKITKRSLDSVSLKLNGKRISLRNLEDALDAPRTNFTVINEYGKKYDCRRCSKDYYGFFGTSPEEYTIHFNTLGELVKHYAFDNIVRDTASETPVDSTLTADIAKYQDVFEKARQISIRAGSGVCKINGEEIWFNYGELRSISSDNYRAEITFNNGRKRFRYRGMITKRADFLDAMNNEIVAAEQKETFDKFYDDYQMPDTALDPNADYFQIRIFPKFANGNEGYFHATANDFKRALEFIELFKSLNLPFIGLIKRNTVCGEEYYRHNRDGSETIYPPEPPKPTDKEPYRPFTPKEEVDIINHNINWAKDTLATMTGDTYTDNIGETFTRNQLKQFIADWQDEIADMQTQADKPAEPPKPVELAAPTVMSALETINAMFPLDGFIEDVSKPNFRSAVNGDWRLNIFIDKNGTPEAVSLAEDDQLLLTVKIKARSLRDSINRAIKTCVKNRIAYRKNHNAEMEKYEYELMHLLQAARRELEVA